MNPMRAARHRAKKTIRQVAEVLGKSERTVMRWELDQAKPGADDVVRLARLYRCRPEQLLRVA
jgi:transcriptional regulator with XRE-family HTH domain